MSLAAISREWYQPTEVTTLTRWLVWAAGVNAVLAFIEGLRGSDTAGLLTFLAAAAFAGAALRRPDGASTPRYYVTLALLAAAFLTGALALVAAPLSAFSIWARAWAILPAALGLHWLAKPLVRAWSVRALSVPELEAGLAHNKHRAPVLNGVATHCLLLHACLAVVIPVLWIADVAISPGNILGGTIGDAFSLEHFATVLGGRDFWLWTRNSVIVAIGTTLMGLSLAIPAAFAFSRYDFAGRKEAMFAFMLVQMFPGAIILVPYFLVMKTLGLLNTSLGLIIAYSVTALPLCIWMLKGFFDAVPRELDEAAKLDGCNQLQVFWVIILPLSLPAVAVTGLFSFLAAWNEFLLALVFNTSNDQFTLPVGLSSLIPANGQRWGDFAAASLLVSLPVVVLFVLFQRSLIQGMSAGAVKG